MYLLIDPCSKIVRQETALDCIKKSHSKEDIEKALVGFSVMASYANQKNYVVSGVDFK